jgi:hypothetical protein
MIEPIVQAPRRIGVPVPEEPQGPDSGLIFDNLLAITKGSFRSCLVVSACQCQAGDRDDQYGRIPPLHNVQCAYRVLVTHSAGLPAIDFLASNGSQPNLVYCAKTCDRTHVQEQYLHPCNGCHE